MTTTKEGLEGQVRLSEMVEMLLAPNYDTANKLYWLVNKRRVIGTLEVDLDLRRTKYTQSREDNK